MLFRSLRGNMEYVEYSAGEDGFIGKEYRGAIGAVYYVSPRISLNLRGEAFWRRGFSNGDQKRLMLSTTYRF